MTGFVVVTAREPIFLLAGRSFPARYAEQRRADPFLPEVHLLVRQLEQLSAAGGVPVTVDDRGGLIRLYVQRCCIAVRLSRYGAYSIEFVDPMRLVSHSRLARSRLRLVASNWVYAAGSPRMPPGSTVPDRELRQAWKRSRNRSSAEELPSRYRTFFRELDAIIKAGRTIDAERNPAGRILPYREVRSTARRRRTATSQYDFTLSRPDDVPTGALVHLRTNPDLRGRVSEIDGRRLTVDFEGAVDRRRITESGELVVDANEVVSRVQTAAVARLRAGSALNPRLLPLLVDGDFLPLTPVAARPAVPLDEAQNDAFERALGVADLLCIEGPPGTGKTTTIVEIAQAAVARGERVLITSQTNKAVDNVLERMPAALTAIRVGNEEKMTQAVRHKTLAATAGQLQERILSRTEATAQRLEPWSGEPSVASRWIRRLGEQLAAGREAEQARDAATAQRAEVAAAVEQRFAAPLARSWETRTHTFQATQAAFAEVNGLSSRSQRADLRAGGPLSFLFGWYARRMRSRLAEAGHRASQAQTVDERAAHAHAALLAQASAAASSDPGVLQAEGRITAAEAAIAQCRTNAVESASQIRRLLAGVEQAPELEPEIPWLVAFHDWCLGWEPFLAERAKLLTAWREQLSRPSELLHADLIRYADVIGVTCIGVGVQANKLVDLDFDLVVVDEAGQIPLASALVPLVRARRMVLVGDHRQLPPYVTDDVRHAVAAGGNGLTDLLVRSAFERLVATAPESNRVMLNQQRRMPAVLANFVSTAFYDGKLLTAGRARKPLAFFSSPLTVVDTSGLDSAARSERRINRTETWQTDGYDNPAEAELVQNLIQAYAAADRDWLVIAPYKAQVRTIEAQLRALLGDQAVSDRIGTVDAFQGQERDVVVFSFTRSNPRRDIGFLGELRRLNVAITRAREQLVLVGDRNTLVHARHPGFRQLARDLFRYADLHGDVVAAEKLKDRLS